MTMTRFQREEREQTKMAPNKKRPGFEAAKRLSQISDVSIWKHVEAQLPEVISSIPPLERLTTSREDIGAALTMKNDDKNKNNNIRKSSLSKDELMTIVQWKFAVGKPRNALLKHLNSNSEEIIQNSSFAAIAKAQSMKEEEEEDENNIINDITTAIQELTTLKGVGPATASAILSIVRPDKFCYMYDECIDCFAPKRTYSLPEYIKVNQECTRIAQSLMDDDDDNGWTPFRISQCLWIAARICAAKGKDHTITTSCGGQQLLLPKQSVSSSKRTLKDNNFKEESKDRRSKKKRTKTS